MDMSVVAALTVGIMTGTGVGISITWLMPYRRQRSATNGGDSREARLARDMTVLADLLADRLAKIWLADSPPTPSADSDSLYHHVLESTTTIVRQAGASAKAAMAVGALTAKRVRPGPIRGRPGD